MLRPLDGVLVASGATGGLIPEIIDMGVPVASEKAQSSEYLQDVPITYADTAKLKSLAVSRGYKKSTNPQPLFPWGDPSTASWSTGSSITLKFSGQTTTKGLGMVLHMFELITMRIKEVHLTMFIHGLIKMEILANG